MAGFHTKTFIQHDDYTTPKEAWDNILHLIPTNKKIWCPFYCDGKQKNIFKELGINIIHEEEDFFENNKGDIIVDNPPFSQYKNIITRLVSLNKPFILILPSSKINTQVIRNLFINQKDKLKIIIPRKRIQFLKDGKVLQNKCNFDCFYYCWKIPTLKRDITWLE